MRYSVLSEYLKWHFYEIPKEIQKGWFNYLRFYLNFFSIPILLKTFFSPWKRYRWSYGRGFSFSRYFEVFISNMATRLIGMVMRTILIIIGLIVDIFILVAGACVYILWWFLPVLIPAIFVIGLNYLF
ncbi:hypothetical protein J7L09_01130 [bacterium]|nr:hypothetical protein [bacterium]